jgi:hypothetical protein
MQRNLFRQNKIDVHQIKIRRNKFRPTNVRRTLCVTWTRNSSPLPARERIEATFCFLTWAAREMRMKPRHAAGLALVAISLLLTGCVLWSPPGHLVTIEPDGSIVKDECVIPMQILVPSERLECQENGAQVIEECEFNGCTYTRDGKVFRECSGGGGLFSTERDCTENGIHVSRKCDRGWSTVTCTEALVK